MGKWAKAFFLVAALLLAVQVNAGPIGDRPKIWPEFQYRNVGPHSPFAATLKEADDELAAMELLFGEIVPPGEGEEALQPPSSADRARIPISAFIFTYGAYLHRWDVPRHQVPKDVLVVQEKPFVYKGPPPDPKPPPAIQKEDDKAYRYPEELISPIHQQPAGLQDTFGLEYAMQLEKDASRFAYPYAPKDAPEPVKQMYMYGEVSPGRGESGVEYGPAQQQPGYQYPSGGAGPGEPGYGPEGEIKKRKKKEKKGGLEDFKQKAPRLVKERSYGMILLGAGLSAVAAVFRMFRLSLFVLVGWMIFYAKDLWLIIVELQ